MIAHLRTALRWLLAFAMVAVGVMHFVSPEGFVKIVPRALPAPLALVLISGALEILGGLGLLVPRTRKLASWGLVALYLAVFPANINMLVNDISLGDKALPTWVLWARLPFQALFIVWAWWVGRDDDVRR